MDEMDDKEWFVQRCLVLEEIIKRAIPENYDAHEIKSVLLEMLKAHLSLAKDRGKATDYCVRFLGENKEL